MSRIICRARRQPAVAANVVLPAVFLASQVGSLDSSVLPANVIVLLLFTACDAPPHEIGILPRDAIVRHRLSSPENVVGGFSRLSSKYVLL